MSFVLLFGWLIALSSRAIENLDGAHSLVDREFELAPGRAVRLRADQVVIRGQVEVELHPDTRDATWSVRDAHGFDEVFLVPSHSLHRLSDGDRLVLFDGDEAQGVWADGRFNEIAGRYEMPHDDHSVIVERVAALWEDGDRRRSVVATGPLCEAFVAGRDAVVVKTCNEVELSRLRDRLLPQIRAYEAHRNDPARFVNVGAGVPPYERRVFERTLEGPLHFDFVDEQNAFEGVKINKKSGAVYRLVPMIQIGEAVRSLRPDDRVFLQNAKGEMIYEYTIRHLPIGMTEPPKLKCDLDLVRILGHARRAVVVRKAFE